MMKEEFFKDFDNFMTVRDNKDKAYYEGDTFHTSTLSLGCPRKSLHERLCDDKLPTKLPKKLIFFTGNSYHALLEEYFPLSKDWKVIGIEMDISDGLPDGFSGKPDVIATHRKTKLNAIFEFKTARSRMFDDHVGSLPKPSHVLQGEIYKYGVRKKGIQIDLLIILYFDKGGEHWPLWYEITDDEYYESDIETIFENANRDLKVYQQKKIYPAKMPMDIKVDDTGKVKIKRGWMCTPAYCDYCTVSCDGRNEVFDLVKVVGHIKNNEFFVNKKYSPYADELAPSVYNYIDSHKMIMNLGGK